MDGASHCGPFDPPPRGRGDGLDGGPPVALDEDVADVRVQLRVTLVTDASRRVRPLCP